MTDTSVDPTHVPRSSEGAPARKRPSRASTFRWGLGGGAVILLGLLVVFGLRPPHLHKPFELNALVRTDASVRKGSAVRIAGVAIGRVTQVRPGPRGSRAAVATMEIDAAGLPLHTDATMKIRPRLLLEGNFFVDLKPGSPTRPRLRSGDMLGADAVSSSVQFDRFLSALDLPTRTSLRGFLQGYGAAIGQPARAGGQTGGQGLNDALRDSPASLRDTAIVSRASRGTQPNDFSKGLGGTGRFLSGLARDDRQLAELITNFDRTATAFADRAPQLRQTIATLDDVTRAAGPSLRTTQRSLPPLAALARRLVPGVRLVKPTIAVHSPWLDQATALLSAPELGGLSSDLQPIVTNAARINHDLRDLTRRVDGVDVCLLNRMLPVSKEAVKDPPLTTGVPLYIEGLQAFAGLGGTAAGFDGNGSFLRTQAGGGTVSVKSSELKSQGPLFGNADTAPLGTRPRSPNAVPPVKTAVRCGTTPKPDLDAAVGDGP